MKSSTHTRNRNRFMSWMRGMARDDHSAAELEASANRGMRRALGERQYGFGLGRMDIPKSRPERAHNIRADRRRKGEA